MIQKQNLCCGAVVCFFSLFMLASCHSSKHSVYFAQQKSGTLATDASIPSTFIQPNDILTISVSSLNVAAAAVFNTPNLSAQAFNATMPGFATPFNGYVVDNDGYIQFPLLGNVRATGLTTEKLKDDLIKQILDKKLLVDPIVNVRFLNFKVTVLGEVNHPLVINVPNQKISLLEALGLAGDITIYGKRDNVLIIREEEDKKKTFYRMDLNSSEIFNSKFYYLKSNDVVYVEPNKARIGAATRTNTLLPILLSGLSFAAIIIDRITR